MEIENYFDEFLNHNYDRDFLAIRDFPRELNSHFPQLTKSRILNERVMYNTKSYYSISIKKNNLRFSDRLFFDFDLEDKTYKELSSSESAREMLFKSNILEKPFDEVSKVYDFMVDNNMKPYILFSGSKGFHCLQFFNPIYLKNINTISMEYANTFANELNLKTIDFSVNKDAHKRKSRLPYSRHNFTDLFTIPIDINMDIEEILYESLNPTIQDFKIADYIINGFSDNLINIDSEISSLLEKQKQIREEKRKIKRKIRSQNPHYSKIDFSEIDFRNMVLDIASDYFVKSMDKYDIYNCPFHQDNHHSAGCYDKRFYCSSCGESWNYWTFIRDFYGFEDDKDIINELKNYV